MKLFVTVVSLESDVEINWTWLDQSHHFSYPAGEAVKSSFVVYTQSPALSLSLSRFLLSPQPRLPSACDSNQLPFCTSTDKYACMSASHLSELHSLHSFSFPPSAGDLSICLSCHLFRPISLIRFVARLLRCVIAFSRGTWTIL